MDTKEYLELAEKLRKAEEELTNLRNEVIGIGWEQEIKLPPKFLTREHIAKMKQAEASRNQAEKELNDFWDASLK